MSILSGIFTKRAVLDKNKLFYYVISIERNGVNITIINTIGNQKIAPFRSSDVQPIELYKSRAFARLPYVLHAVINQIHHISCGIANIFNIHLHQLVHWWV